MFRVPTKQITYNYNFVIGIFPYEVSKQENDLAFAFVTFFFIIFFSLFIRCTVLNFYIQLYMSNWPRFYV